MDVFTFLDPYLFMQSYYQLRKSHEKTFSYATWAEELDLNSSSTLRLMVNRKKKLSRGVAERFLQKCFAANEEKNYFRLMTSYTHAATVQDKNATWAALSQILTGRCEQEEAADYITYVSDLLIPKIQVLISFADAEWTAEKLATVLESDVAEVDVALTKLAKIGLAASSANPQGKLCWKARRPF